MYRDGHGSTHEGLAITCRCGYARAVRLRPLGPVVEEVLERAVGEPGKARSVGAAYGDMYLCVNTLI